MSQFQYQHPTIVAMQGRAAAPYSSGYAQPEMRMARRTAMHDLEAFISSLPQEDRTAVLSNPEYMAASGQLTQGFVAWLLSSETGAAYQDGPGKAPAENLLLVAQEVHSRIKAETQNQAQTEIEGLKEQVRKLEAKLADKKGKSNAE